MFKTIPIIFSLLMLSMTSAKWVSNVFLSPRSVNCESSGNSVQLKCKIFPLHENRKVSGLLIDANIKVPITEARYDVEIEQKLFTPFFIKMLKFSYEACSLLNLTEHESISDALEFGLRFVPTIPREYIHPCPYQGPTKFNLTFNFHDAIANYVRGAYKIHLKLHNDDDPELAKIDLEIEAIEV